jgi:hypothetical protein
MHPIEQLHRNHRLGSAKHERLELLTRARVAQNGKAAPPAAAKWLHPMGLATAFQKGTVSRDSRNRSPSRRRMDT